MTGLLTGANQAIIETIAEKLAIERIKSPAAKNRKRLFFFIFSVALARDELKGLILLVPLNSESVLFGLINFFFRLIIN
jgi:hypothetical protein